MRVVLIAASLCILGASAAQAKPFRDEIPQVFRGTWAPTLAACRDPDGVDQLFIDGESVNYYEGNDYLLIGIEFWGIVTKSKGSGSLFNGRFTGRSETNLLGESNIRMEIDDRDKDVMYRYPIGDDGDPIEAREVKDVRCIGK
jgi:hypothetical protein